MIKPAKPIVRMFSSSRVDSTTEEADGWLVKTEDGWVFAPNKECSVTPAAGERVECYGPNIAHPVQGLVIGGRTYLSIPSDQ